MADQTSSTPFVSLSFHEVFWLLLFNAYYTYRGTLPVHVISVIIKPYTEETSSTIQ